jgi:hypothetical protein
MVTGTVPPSVGAPEKFGKFSKELGQLLNAFLKPFALKKHQDAPV